MALAFGGGLLVALRLLLLLDVGVCGLELAGDRDLEKNSAPADQGQWFPYAQRVEF